MTTPFPQQPPSPWQQPAAGQPLAPTKKGRWYTSKPFIGAAALVVGLGIGASGGGSGGTSGNALPAPTVTVTAEPAAAPPAPTATTTVTVTQTAEAPGPSAAFGDGVHLVGSDIQPGTYKAANPGGRCYWARLKDTSGELGSIIANDNAGGQAVVTIRKTDAAFESTRCGDWVKVS